jgi:putative transposase
VLAIGRAGLHRESPRARPSSRPSPPWTETLRQVIQQHPPFGYRRLWAFLRFQEGIVVNHKAVYRVLKQKRWFVHQRSSTPRPRVRGWVSRANRSNERWAMDVTHIACGQDGWAHLAAVIDCHDRELIGYEFALRSLAKEAERAVEAACLQRFGTLRPVGAPVLRSENGLIFQSRRFRQACRDYRLQQEFITPYTPEQNGMIERFFRSLKEVCVWNTRSRRLRRRGGSFGTGSSGTTMGGRIRPWGTEARSNTAPNMQPKWLDFRGALHDRAGTGSLYSSVEQLAQTLDASERGLEILCRIFGDVRVVKETRRCLPHQRLAATQLNADHPLPRGYLELLKNQWADWSHLTDTVRSGRQNEAGN